MVIDIEKTVAVIGAGPAGIAAAIQLGRYGIRTLVFEKAAVGGLLRNANLVENYPGFPGGIKGPELAGLFERQLGEAGISLILEEVETLYYNGRQFAVKTANNEYKAAIVVAASGTVPLRPESITMSSNTAAGVCCEATEVKGAKGKKIAVIGSGDAAFDYALNLSGENDVIIIMRTGSSKCLALLRERCDKNAGIELMEKTEVRSIVMKDDKLRLDCVVAGYGEKAVEADHVLLAVGREPCTGYMDRSVGSRIDLLLEKGILYLVGDIKNGLFRQAAISTGDGIRAAMEIERIFRQEC